MATTTNFGWETPDDTDLVKDGAAAIRTALGGVDTSFVDLKGGTTGQVLAKASNTDMDFTWAAAGPSFKGVRVFKSTNQTISTSTVTNVTFDSETFDTDAFHSNTTNNTRLTVPSGLAGYYQITHNVRFNGSITTGRKVGGLQLNGTTDLATYEFQPYASPVEASATVTTTQFLSVGDYITAITFQTSGVNQDLTGLTNSTYLEMRYLGA